MPLVLTRRFEERVRIRWQDRTLWVSVSHTTGSKVKLVLDGDIKDLEILREELLTDKQVEDGQQKHEVQDS